MEFARCSQNISDWDILNLFVPDSELDLEVTWLISSYVIFIWENIFVRNAEVKFEQFFGYLSFNYKSLQTISKNQMRFLNGIS